MRELERELSSDTPARAGLAIVGRGRVGTALAAALRRAGYEVSGPLGRGADGARRRRRAAVRARRGDRRRGRRTSLRGPLVGHCSGATGLGALAPHEAFSLHPLMTVTAEGAEFAGAGAAIAGSTPRALGLAAELARALGMRPVEIAEPRPRRLPRRRIDRLELPGHARGRRRAHRRRGRHRARAARAAGARDGRELGPARPRAGPDRTGGPRRRGHDRAAASGDRRGGAPTWWRCSTRS